MSRIAAMMTTMHACQVSEAYADILHHIVEFYRDFLSSILAVRKGAL